MLSLKSQASFKKGNENMFLIRYTLYFVSKLWLKCFKTKVLGNVSLQICFGYSSCSRLELLLADPCCSRFFCYFINILLLLTQQIIKCVYEKHFSASGRLFDGPITAKNWKKEFIFPTTISFDFKENDSVHGTSLDKP